MTTTPVTGDQQPLLTAILNLAHYHRDHERFYAASPREAAVVLQRHARTLQSLADRWSTVDAGAPSALSPFAGADDLNDGAALQLDGVLFMEGEGRPAEVTNLIRELRTRADDSRTTGEWLANAMQASWEVARSLISIDGLADLLGERHRIISNDWLAASMNHLIAETLDRAAEILDSVDFTPTALREDLAGARISAKRLYSAAEMIDRAADLFSESAGLVHDNERRWRVFRSRVAELVGPIDPGG